MGKQPFIRLEHVEKSFPGVKALDDVSLDIIPGEVHALVGENGAGKSTLIKILAGVYNLDAGSCYIDEEEVIFQKPKDAIEKGINVIYQELNLINDLSVAENIFLGKMPKTKYGLVDYQQLKKKTEEVLAKVGIVLNPMAAMRSFPVAIQQLCEVGKALSVNSRLVIMDEPTSALSHSEIENLFSVIDELKKKHVAILYVSHKLEEIFRISDRITVLRDGRHITTDLKKNFTEKTLISSMVGRDVNVMYQRVQHERKGEILRVEHMTTDFVKDISFDLYEGEVIGFAGLMGAGRTEIARGIFGLDKVHAGDVYIGGQKVVINNSRTAVRNGIGMVPEDRKDAGIITNLNVRMNISISSLKQFLHLRYIKNKKELGSVEEIIKRMNVKTPSPEQMIVNLSGGNQQKVILSRWIIKEDLRVLIIDEPTRGIDIGAKEEIYKLIDTLAKAGLAIIVISSELPEIISLCDRVFIVKGGKIRAELQKDELSEEAALSHAL